MKVRFNNYIKLLIMLIILTGFMSGVTAQPIEELLITNGIGYDLEKKAGGELQFIIPTSFYTFKNEKLYSCDVRRAIGTTIGNAREDRQTKISNKFVLGFEKVYLFSEDISENGIKTIIDFLFNNPAVNDNGSIAVISGSAENAFKRQIEGANCAADDIDGIIRNLNNNNFFSKHYNLSDIYLKTTQEGKSLVIPYMESTNEGFEVKGLCLFKNYKMIGKLDMNETRFFNLLRENKCHGHVDLQRSPTESFSFYGTSKRKVTCEKNGDKYKFTIEISLKGDILENEMFNNFYNNINAKKEVEKEIEDKIKKSSETLIKKMQNDYSFDGLELGSVAAAKYGRRTGIDWNKVISDSEIEVKPNVHIERTGRGDL